MIQFFAELPIKPPFKKEEHIIRSWLQSIAAQEHKKISELTYVFCNDSYLLELNRNYLNHDTYTDIITFPYQEGDNIESDIFISVDRVTENAANFQVTFRHEICRVMVHGLLHLIGYNDTTAEESQLIREKENFYLDYLGSTSDFLK